MKLKLFILLTLLLGILACGVATLMPTAEPAQVDAVPEVEEEKPVIIPTASFTPEPQEAIIEEKLNCVELLTPENETEFGESAKVTFSWTIMDNAASYILNITLPSEDIVAFKSEEIEITRYIEAFTQAGEFQWNITALNAAGEEICSSDFFTFAKPLSDGASKESSSDGDSENDGPPPDGDDWGD